MPEPLLGLLKLCALALLYLFFFRVLRAVWAEVRPKPAMVGGAPARSTRSAPERPAGGRRRSRGTSRVVVVEPRERKGQAWDLGEELTIGRAAGCQISFEDSYVSQLHARVFARNGTHHVEDLGSTNGTFLNDTKVTTAVPMRRGDRLKIGSTVLEVG
jgi:pSer/pThr/pTyr-binding forkhead associated (FHA) protein